MLSKGAFNALLKTLEEPPERVIFILATTRAEDLVETIKSRAQVFQFRTLTFQEISGEIERIAKAENLQIESGAVAVLARAAEGSLRDGLSLLEQAISYSGETITDAQVRELLGVVAEDVLDELVEAVHTQSADRALNLVHRLIADGQNLQHFCREAIRHFRNLLVTRISGADSELVAAPPDERPRLAKQAEQFGEEDLTRFFNLLLATDDDLRRKPDPRLHLELGLLKLVNAQRLAPLEEALAELRAEGGSGPRTLRPSSTAPATRAVSGSAETRPGAPTTRFSGPVSGFAPPSTATSASAAAAARMAPVPAVSAAPAAAAQSSAAIAEAPESTSTMAGDSTGSPTPEEKSAADGNEAELSESPQVREIKTAVQSQKFLWSMAGAATRWEVEGGELRIYFPPESRTIAEMLQARDPMERLRTVLTRVTSEPLRVCVKLEGSRPAAARGSDLQARFEKDPMVRAMLERFGGQISKVKRPGEE